MDVFGDDCEPADVSEEHREPPLPAPSRDPRLASSSVCNDAMSGVGTKNVLQGLLNGGIRIKPL